MDRYMRASLNKITIMGHLTKRKKKEKEIEEKQRKKRKIKYK
jgi:hypothetical protein